MVLKQALQKNCVTELKREIEQEKLSIVQVIPVLAKDYHVDGQGILYFLVFSIKFFKNSSSAGSILLKRVFIQ